MFRSVKSQITVAITLIILVVLGATAYLVIDQKTREINQDIFSKAVSFAELTHERLIRNYEENYSQGVFVNFNREIADIYALDEDITGVIIYNNAGTELYRDPDLISRNLTDEGLERIQAVFPSVKIKGDGRIIYLDKTRGYIRYANNNGQSVLPVGSGEQIDNVIYPFQDQNNISRSFSIEYEVTYDALFQRVRETTMQIIIIAAIGLVVAIFVGYLVAYKITVPIHALTQGAKKIGSWDLKTRIDVQSKSEIGVLAKTFNKMAADLELSIRAMAKHEQTAKELELAAEIQQEFLPKELPKIKNLDIAASLVAATEVGGDCYDLIPVEKGEKLLFYVADVTGHGVGAGLVSAINNALVPSLLDHYESTKDIVVHLNKVLKLKTASNIFVTSVMVLWDNEESAFEFTQAGHDPILHYKASENSVIELPHGGVALGMIEEIEPKLNTHKVLFQKGDVLVLYTDGIPEAWNNNKEHFGMGRLREVIKRHAKTGASAQVIHDEIIKEVKEFMGDFPQADDITLLVVKKVGG